MTIDDEQMEPGPVAVIIMLTAIIVGCVFYKLYPYVTERDFGTYDELTEVKKDESR